MPAGRESQSRFVSFSGMDGAGKSTQIALLQSRLERTGTEVRIITFWDDVARFTRFREATGHKLFKGDKGVGSPDTPINRRDKNVRSWPMTLVRLFLYTADALSLRKVVRKALRSGTAFIICDRYAWDELANLTLSNPAIRLYVRLITRLVPAPDVSYVLDADPVLARARKPEYPVDFLCLCREAYLTLSKLTGRLTVIPPGSVHEVHGRILQELSMEPLQDRRPMTAPGGTESVLLGGRETTSGVCTLPNPAG